MTNQQNQLKALTAELEASRMREAELSAMLSNTIGAITAHNRVIAGLQRQNTADAQWLAAQQPPQRYPTNWQENPNINVVFASGSTNPLDLTRDNRRQPEPTPAHHPV